MDVAPWTTRDERRHMISLGLGDTPPDAVPRPELTPQLVEYSVPRNR